MKVALFSDIHANLPAFEAFIKDIEDREVDAIYCLGDLIGYNIWPNEIIDIIRKRQIPTIAGNHDYNISRLGKGNIFLSKGEMTDGAKSVNYTNEQLTESNIAYLKSLPAQLKIIQEQEETPFSVLLVHGSPNRNNEYMTEDFDEEVLKEFFIDNDCDVICCGHTHKPFYRTTMLNNQPKHLINIGSVGKPKDNDNRGCYAIINLETTNSEELDVTFIRFEYDIEKAAQAVENSDLPNVFADKLRNGN